MNYLSGALNYIAGDEAKDVSRVARLIERIKSSALPQDRRSAVTELENEAKKSPEKQEEIGQAGFRVFYAILEQDKEYDDTIRATLELLISICGQLDESLEDSATERRATAAANNVKLFLSLPNAIPLLLDLLSNDDFYVRLDVIELLTAMAANASVEVQSAILAAPEGVTRLSDALDDSRELIQSNILILLTALSDGSAEICKILAFSGAMDKIFALFGRKAARNNFDDQEGSGGNSLEDAIMVHDKLVLLKNLLAGAESTHSYLREGDKIVQLGRILTTSANVLRQNSVRAAPGTSSDKQWADNICTCLQCIELAVLGQGTDAMALRSDFASSGILKTVISLAFGQVGGNSKRPAIRVWALKAVAALLRGHHESHLLFSTPIALDESRTFSPQLAAVETLSTDPSAAVRAAAFGVLKQSFIKDPGLDLPSSVLLNALLGSPDASSQPSLASYSSGTENRKPRSSASTADALTSDLSTLGGRIKVLVTGWPDDADEAGVFYAASLISWTLLRIDGAKERLLSSRVDPSGDMLLAKCVRTLGRADRRNAPASVRVGLLRLLCCWLYRSPSAVSTFLSSAMNLPLIMELLSKEGSRGDPGEVHTQGLSALLLGLCLDAAEVDESDQGFVSGEEGASVVFSAAKISDIIKNRVGVTAFTARLDELRSSDAYRRARSSESKNAIWPIVPLERLLAAEASSGPATKTDNLGHTMWYDYDFACIVDDLYEKLGARALDLMVDDRKALRLVARTNGGSGLSAAQGQVDTERYLPNGSSNGPLVLADSTRDEVILSYKEFIRNQDSSLDEARTQVRELTAALKEAQMELDRSIAENRKSESSEELKLLKQALLDAQEREKTYETLLREKTADFEAVSRAYSALEADRSFESGGRYDSDNVGLPVELEQLKQQKEKLLHKLDKESLRADDLQRENEELRSASMKSKAQMDALIRERDNLQQAVEKGLDGATNLVEIAELRRRVALAESAVKESERARNESSLVADGLRRVVRKAESELEEARAAEGLARAASGWARKEIERLKAYRAREVQVTKESMAQSASATQREIAMLQKDLAAERASKSTLISETEAAELRAQAVAARKSADASAQQAEGMRTELIDTQNSLREWRGRAEAAIGETESQREENKRLAAIGRELQDTIDALKAEVESRSDAAAAASRKEAELESRMKEERAFYESTIKSLRDEAASRAEQTIRLSERIYKAEEAEAEAETLKKEHSSTKERLVDVEAKLKESVAKCRELENTVDVLQEAKLSLEEAEESKRTLTSQVLALKEALAQAEQKEKTEASAVTHKETSLIGQETQDSYVRVTELEATVQQIRDDKKAAERRIAELEQKAVDDDALLSVLGREKSDLSSKLVQLEEGLRASSEDKKTLEGRVAALESSIKTLDREKSDLSSKLVQLEEDLRSSCEEKNACEQQVATLESSIKVLSREKSDLCSRLALQDRDLSSSREEKDALEQKVANLESRIKNAEAEGKVSGSHNEILSARGQQQLRDQAKQNDESQTLLLEKRAVDAEDNLIALQTASVSVIRGLREELVAQRSESNSAIADLVAKLSILEASSQASKQKLAEKTHKQREKHAAEVQELQSALRGAETNLQKTRNKARDLETSLTSLRDTLRASVDEKRHLEAHVAHLVSQKEDNMSKLSYTKNKINELQLMIDAASKNKDAEVEKKLESANKRAHALEAQLEMKEEEIARLKVSLDNSSLAAEQVFSALFILEEKVSAVESRQKDARESAAKTSSSLEQSLRASEGAEKAAKAELEQMRLMHSTASSELQVMRDRVAHLTGEISRMSMGLDSSENLKNDALMKVAELEEAIGKSRATLAATEARCDVLKSAFEKELQKLRSEIAALRVAAESDKAASNEEANKLKELAKTLENELGRRNIELKKCKGELSLTEAKLTNLVRKTSKEISDLKAAAEFKNAELSSAQSQKAELEVALEDLRESSEKRITGIINDRRSICAQLEETSNALKATQKSLQTQKDLTRSAESDRKLQRKLLSQMQTELSRAKSEMESLLSQMVSLKNEKEGFLKMIDSLRNRTGQLEENIMSVRRDLENEKRTSADLRDNVKQAQSDVERSHRARLALETENDDLRTELDRVEGQQLDTKENLRMAVKDNECLREWVSSLEHRASELQSVASQFEEVEQTLHEEMEAHQRATEKVSSLEEEKHELEVKQSQSDAKVKALTKEKELLEKKCTAFQKRVEELDADVQCIRKSQVEKFGKYEEKLRESAARTLELESLALSAERRITEAAAVGDRMKSLESEAARKDEEIVELSARIRSLEDECNELRKAAAQLEKEIEAERNSSSRQAYAELEAEYNELLVCLAEIELENSSARERLSQYQSVASAENLKF